MTPRDESGTGAGAGEHLSTIETCWTDVRNAHHGSAEVVRAAQQRLIQRYGAAISRYLRAALHDPNEADEVFQKFALRLARGDFRGADSHRGRFRSYLKAALFRLVYDHRKQRSRQPALLLESVPEPAAQLQPQPGDASEQEFLAIWREELLAAAWRALADLENRTGKPLHAVLKYRVQHPGVRSFETAAHFAARLGKPLSPEWVRKRLHQARETFIKLVVDEVAFSLEHPTTEALEQELLDLGLLDYCRAHLGRRGS
jgi:DNA-directed RNA polymerase specialized sigma24 family protein